VLDPAIDGFPIDFTIAVWDGKQWQVRVTQTDHANPGLAAQVYALGRTDFTDRVRVTATRLRVSHGHYVLRLAEIKLEP
jgi:hypothetical protein